MSDKAAAGAATASTPPSGKGGVVVKIAIGVVTLLLVAGAAIGGALFGPQLLNRGQPQGAGAKAGADGKTEELEEEEPSSGKKDELPEIESLESLVVDIRAASGELHHLKVTIGVEIKGALVDEEFKKLVPRGRDAAIEYLRSLDYDDITSPAHYQAIRQELNTRIVKAMGKKTIKRILFTDFVVQ